MRVEVALKFRGHVWTWDDLSVASMNGSADGICVKCKAVSSGHEPDAKYNYCPSCGELHVASVLVLMKIV